MADEIIENIFLVNAPAGSGKTTTIRKMVEKRLREKPSDNILCITYTNRAAEELGKDITSEKVFFGTIHSFINHFISSFFSHEAVIDLYWENYKDQIEERIANPQNKESIRESNQRYIDKYEALSLEIVRRNLKEISYSEAPYTSLYRGALSHDDLISFTRKMIDRFPVIKKKIADKYQLIFIDEYQDTSAHVLHIFYEAMKYSKGELYLFGDKMQQIYNTYDGSFEKEFATLNCSFNLSINYRTTPCIVSILNKIYNNKKYEQSFYEVNKDEKMDYRPEVIFSEHPAKTLEEKRQKYPNALVLYLLNKERFQNIGAGALYETVQNIEKYQFGGKYSVVDVLTKTDNSNPDKLFSLLFLIKQINDNYNQKIYGKLIRIIKNNKYVFNASKYTIKRHSDKKTVNQLLYIAMEKFNQKDTAIKDFLLFLKNMGMVNPDYVDEIVEDEDYTEVLNVAIREFDNLASYLDNPHISTQHGVKGESHETVFFMAANNSNRPVVSMSRFLKLWSTAEVSLPAFDQFYYDYKNLIHSVEQTIGMKCKELRKEQYEYAKQELTIKLADFKKKHETSGYYKCLLEEYFEKYFSKPGVTCFGKCLNENLVYGALSAYRLFYVGCSRARRNLSIIIDLENVKGFESEIRDKFARCGFRVD